MSASDVWEIARIEALAPDQKSVAAARALLTADTFSQVEPTSDGRGWWAVCQGATDLYRVAVRPTADGFDCECSCPSRKYPCKHALALLVYLADRPALRVTAGRVGRAPADFEGLVRAVFAAPADDLPRLVFADYLDETGRPDRAALIRTQCEMARIGGADPQFPALAEAEHDLTARLREEVGEFPEGFGGEFHRGFLRLGVNADAFGRIASLPARVVNLFLNGWVETVRFHMPLGSVEGEAHNLLRRVGELDFTSVRLTDTELVILAAEFPVGAEGSRLARVRVHPLDSDLFQALAQGTRAAPPPPALLPAQQPDVHRHYSDLTPDRLARLVWAGRLNGVLSLHLRGSSLGDEGISVLAADETLGLRELDLWGAGVGPAGAAAIAAAPWFPALSELRVGGSPLVNAGVAALGEPAAPCWLTRLGLDEVGVGDAGMVGLARSARFSALEAIDLQGNEVTEVGAAALLGSAHFPALRRLELAYNPIDARRRADLVLTAADRPHLEVFFGSSYSERPIVRAVERGPTGEVVRFTIPRSDPGVIDGLADSPALGTITALTIHDTQIAPDAAGRIAAGLSPARWQELDLTGCSLGETPGAVVERFCSGHRLAQLTLAGIGLKYSAAFKLALCPALAGVRTLDLSNNPLGTGGLEALLGSPHLSGVERIVLKGLNLSQRERAHYQKQFGRRAEF